MERTISRTVTEKIRTLFVTNPTGEPLSYDFGGHTKSIAAKTTVELPESEGQHVLGLFQGRDVTVSEHAPGKEPKRVQNRKPKTPEASSAPASRAAGDPPPPPPPSSEGVKSEEDKAREKAEADAKAKEQAEIEERRKANAEKEAADKKKAAADAKASSDKKAGK